MYFFVVLAGPLRTVMVLLLVPPLILSLLLLIKQLNFLAVLEVVALGAVDFAVLLAGAPWLVGSRQGSAGGAPGNLLAGGVCFDLLAGTGDVRPLNGKHGLVLAFPIATPA